jgi:hypothetical protein
VEFYKAHLHLGYILLGNMTNVRQPIRLLVGVFLTSSLVCYVAMVMRQAANYDYIFVSPTIDQLRYNKSQSLCLQAMHMGRFETEQYAKCSVLDGFKTKSERQHNPDGSRTSQQQREAEFASADHRVDVTDVQLTSSTCVELLVRDISDKGDDTRVDFRGGASWYVLAESDHLRYVCHTKDYFNGSYRVACAHHGDGQLHVTIVLLYRRCRAYFGAWIPAQGQTVWSKTLVFNKTNVSRLSESTRSIYSDWTGLLAHPGGVLHAKTGETNLSTHPSGVLHAQSDETSPPTHPGGVLGTYTGWTRSNQQAEWTFISRGRQQWSEAKIRQCLMKFPQLVHFVGDSHTRYTYGYVLDLLGQLSVGNASKVIDKRYVTANTTHSALGMFTFAQRHHLADVIAYVKERAIRWPNQREYFVLSAGTWDIMENNLQHYVRLAPLVGSAFATLTRSGLQAQLFCCLLLSYKRIITYFIFIKLLCLYW